MTTPQPEKPRKFMLTIPEDVYAELIYLKLQTRDSLQNIIIEAMRNGIKSTIED